MLLGQPQLCRLQLPLRAVRRAHLSASSSAPLSSRPSVDAAGPVDAATPPTRSSLHTSPAAEAIDREVFLSRYRDPAYHDKARAKPGYYVRHHSDPDSTEAPVTSSASSSSSNVAQDDSPRGRRLAMEQLWSGGDYSPVTPVAHYANTTSTAKKHALMFPGSASQYVGMASFIQDFPAAKRVWEEAEDALAGFEEWRRSLHLDQAGGEVGELGRMLEESYGERRLEAGLRRVVFDGPQDELTRSSNAQPAILITSISLLKTLEDNFAASIVKDADYFLGHSSGEYTAAVASQFISFADGVRLTRLHGLLTTHALALPSINLSPSPFSSSAQRAQMSALVINPGHSHAEVSEIVLAISQTGAKVEVASYNSSAQIVLAGTRDGILRASEVLKEKNIAVRAADLPVSSPFHCSFMKPAGEGMRIALNQLNLSTPTAPVLSGGDGSAISTPADLISNLVSQISEPVRWSTCLSSLRTAGISQLVFFGPGKALANLARKDLASLEQDKLPADRTEVLSVATQEDMQSVKSVWAER